MFEVIVDTEQNWFIRGYFYEGLCSDRQVGSTWTDEEEVFVSHKSLLSRLVSVLRYSSTPNQPGNIRKSS